MPREMGELQVLTADMDSHAHSVSTASSSGFGSPVQLMDVADRFQGARMKMDELFVFWLSQRETNRMLRQYLDAIASGTPVGDEPAGASLLTAYGTGSSASLSPRSLSPHKGAGVHLQQAQLPRSPTAKSTYWPAGTGPTVGNQSGTAPGPVHGGTASTRAERFERFLSPEKRVERSPSRASSTVSDDSGAQRPQDSAAAAAAAVSPAAAGHQRLPPFYQADEGGRGRGRPIPGDRLEVRATEIEELFKPHPEGLLVEDFVPVTKTLCGFPSFFNAVLFRRILDTTATTGGSDADAAAGGGGSGASTSAGRRLSGGGNNPASKAKGGGGGGGSNPQAAAAAAGGSGAVGGVGGATGRGRGMGVRQNSGSSVQRSGSDAGSVNLQDQAGEGDAGGAEGQPLRVTKDVLMRYWRQEIEPFDHIDRFFRLVKQPDADSIAPEDFAPLIRELLLYHPGLEFLESHPDFHPKYTTTVTTRFFYNVDTRRNGRISARELRRSNLVEAFNLVDEEEDINKVTDYFSYEHFYVLFCRFYELDSDRDGVLTREDLLKYGEHGLSEAIVDRIFDAGERPYGSRKPFQSLTGASAPAGAAAGGSGGAGSPAAAAEEAAKTAADAAAAVPLGRGGMSYEDYVYFMLSEEDRGHAHSLRYWFTCLDLDGDGRVSHVDMRHFYDVQVRRMESLSHEVVPYEDVACQMWDLLKMDPARDYLELQDLLKPDTIKVAGVLFDALFNLNKFIAFEQRDPFAERQKRNDPFESDWDRFAYHDYNRLAAEDEREAGDAMEDSATDEWVVTSDDEEEDAAFGLAVGKQGQSGGGNAEAPF